MYLGRTRRRRRPEEVRGERLCVASCVGEIANRVEPLLCLLLRVRARDLLKASAEKERDQDMRALVALLCISGCVSAALDYCSSRSSIKPTR